MQIPLLRQPFREMEGRAAFLPLTERMSGKRQDTRRHHAASSTKAVKTSMQKMKALSGSCSCVASAAAAQFKESLCSSSA